MTPQEIRTRRLALGITPTQAARLVGVDSRSWRRWEATAGDGARTMPEPVCRLLRLLEWPDGRALLEYLADQAEPTEDAP